MNILCTTGSVGLPAQQSKQNENIIMNKTFFITILISLLLTTSCFSKKKITEARKLSNYTFNNKIDIAQRIETIPSFLLENLMKSDKRSNYKNYKLSQKDLQLLKQYIDLLPKKYQQILKKRLVKIYFVENLLGSGLMTFLFDENKKPHPILVINPIVLNMSMSKWTSYRINTCFKKIDKDVQITINSGVKYKGLLGILIHESSHIVDFHNKISFNKKKKNKFSSFNGIWLSLNKPINKYKKMSKYKISFYGINNSPNIDNINAKKIFTELEKTPFVSLYGSKNKLDDFAEIMTYYILTKKLNQPYEIQILKKNKLVYIYKPMENNLISKRSEIIYKLLNSNNI